MSHFNTTTEDIVYDTTVYKIKSVLVNDIMTVIPSLYTIKSFHGHKMNEPRCLGCLATDHGTIIHRFYISQPCRCCGAEDHSMLGIKQDKKGKLTTILTCPIIEIPYGMTLKEQIDENHFRYRTNGYTFASYHGFNIDETTKALKLLFKNGNGNNLPSHYLNDFKQHVVDICQNEHDSWTFKRGLIGDNSKDEYEL
jgi:hypothetical protein